MSRSKFIQPKAIKRGEFVPPDVERLYRLVGEGGVVLEDFYNDLSVEERELIRLMDFDPTHRSETGLFIEPHSESTIYKKALHRGDKWHADFNRQCPTAFVRTKMASFPYGTKYIAHGEIPGLELAVQLPPIEAAEFLIGSKGQAIINAAIKEGKVGVEEVKPGEVLECPEMFIHRGPTASERDGTRAWARSVSC